METLFIGKNLLFLHDVESTNTYAMNLLRNVNGIEGTVVYTDNQTQGKGQRGAVWSSDSAKNLIASIILKPQFLGIENTFYLSKISALAVYDVLTEILSISQYDIKIKWPNDMLVNQSKIAGILIENNVINNHLQYAVIGIGLNINQVSFTSFLREATSLQLLANKQFDKNAILERLCINLEKWYFKLKEEKYQLIDDVYVTHLFGVNKNIDFVDSSGIKFFGKILGVTQLGKLTVELETKQIKEFDIKEVQFEQ
jgi:BirA family biotin operon repressor/biotin-[acetyl-CoA-carboxylase] ligase